MRSRRETMRCKLPFFVIVQKGSDDSQEKWVEKDGYLRHNVWFCSADGINLATLPPMTVALVVIRLHPFRWRPFRLVVIVLCRIVAV